jgi:uncharacterized membrane protein (UPF0127 family)
MKLMLVAASVPLAMALAGSSCGARKVEDLDKLGAVRLTIKNKAFELWIADDSAEQQQGLMHVTAERMAPLPDGAERGMIFIFDYEHELSFWMKDTIIPLDIAYLDSKGKVVSTHTMAPLDVRPWQYPSGKPAKFAIEVNAGVFATIGLRVGDIVDVPASLLKRIP